MIKFLDSPQPQCLACLVSDPFSSDEYLLLLDKLTEIAQKYQKINILIISKGGKKEVPTNIWIPQSKETNKAVNSIERIGIVGTKENQIWAKKLFAPLLEHAIKHFFGIEQKQEASFWSCTGKGILLTDEEQIKIRHIASRQSPTQQWAEALLLLDKGVSIKHAAEQTGLTSRQVRYRRDRFLLSGMELFSPAINEKKETVIKKEKIMNIPDQNKESPEEPKTGDTKIAEKEVAEEKVVETITSPEQPETSEPADPEIIEEQDVSIEETSPPEETAISVETSTLEPAAIKEKSPEKAPKKSKKGKKKASKGKKNKSKKGKQTKKQTKTKKKKKSKKQKENKKKKKDKKNKK